MKNATRRTSALLASAGLAVSLSLAGAAPANAANVTKSDRLGDAPAHLDIESVTYRNNKFAVSAKIRVPDLERRGRVSLAVGPPDTDFGYEAIVRIGADKKLKARLRTFDIEGYTRVRCAVSARWVASKNFVRVAVPQTCMNLKERRLYVAASTGKWTDRAQAARNLRRG